MAQDSLQCLAQLASMHGPIFPDESAQISYLAHLVEGLLSMINGSVCHHTGKHSVYHSSNSSGGYGSRVHYHYWYRCHTSNSLSSSLRACFVVITKTVIAAEPVVKEMDIVEVFFDTFNHSVCSR